MIADAGVRVIRRHHGLRRLVVKADLRQRGREPALPRAVQAAGRPAETRRRATGRCALCHRALGITGDDRSSRLWRTIASGRRTRAVIRDAMPAAWYRCCVSKSESTMTDAYSTDASFHIDLHGLITAIRLLGSLSASSFIPPRSTSPLRRATTIVTGALMRGSRSASVGISSESSPAKHVDWTNRAAPAPTTKPETRSGCWAAAHSAADTATMSGATMSVAPRFASMMRWHKSAPIEDGRTSGVPSDSAKPGSSTANTRACSASAVHIRVEDHWQSGHELVKRIDRSWAPPLSA